MNCFSSLSSIGHHLPLIKDICFLGLGRIFLFYSSHKIYTRSACFIYVSEHVGNEGYKCNQGGKGEGEFIIKVAGRFVIKVQAIVHTQKIKKY